jgi:ribosome biogenesis protein ENP2
MKDSQFNFKKLKKNEEYTNRIEIIQDFELSVSAGCIKATEDGNYLFASGIYPPRLKIYDLHEMTMKCERGFDAEIRKIEMISEDYSKAAFLLEDRNIEIHAQYGKHFRIRIPRYGRDLSYHKTSCDIFSVGSGNEIYRLNLYEGQFVKSLESQAESINALSINYAMELLGVAGEKGIVELWDLREKNKVLSLPILENSFFKDYE